MLLRALIRSANGGSRQVSTPPMFRTLHREIDRLLEDFTRGNLLASVAQNNLVPSIDVVETDNAIEVTAELPGLERKDVEISVEDDVLTIRGEKRIEMRDDGSDQKQSASQEQAKTQGQEYLSRNYVVAERSYGVFLRGLQLPPGIDQSKIQVSMSNGVLKISIPKPRKAEPKKIEVHEGKGVQQAA